MAVPDSRAAYDWRSLKGRHPKHDWQSPGKVDYAGMHAGLSPDMGERSFHVASLAALRIRRMPAALVHCQRAGCVGSRQPAARWLDRTPPAWPGRARTAHARARRSRRYRAGKASGMHNGSDAPSDWFGALTLNWVLPPSRLARGASGQPTKTNRPRTRPGRSGSPARGPNPRRRLLEPLEVYASKGLVSACPGTVNEALARGKLVASG